jgi:hypothetical protein
VSVLVLRCPKPIVKVGLLLGTAFYSVGLLLTCQTIALADSNTSVRAKESGSSGRTRPSTRPGDRWILQSGFCRVWTIRNGKLCRPDFYLSEFNPSTKKHRSKIDGQLTKPVAISGCQLAEILSARHAGRCVVNVTQVCLCCILWQTQIMQVSKRLLRDVARTAFGLLLVISLFPSAAAADAETTKDAGLWLPAIRWKSHSVEWLDLDQPISREENRTSLLIAASRPSGFECNSHGIVPLKQSILWPLQFQAAQNGGTFFPESEYVRPYFHASELGHAYSMQQNGHYKFVHTPGAVLPAQSTGPSRWRSPDAALARVTGLFKMLYPNREMLLRRSDLFFPNVSISHGLEELLSGLEQLGCRKRGTCNDDGLAPISIRYENNRLRISNVQTFGLAQFANGNCVPLNSGGIK